MGNSEIQNEIQRWEYDKYTYLLIYNVTELSWLAIEI